MNSVNLPTIDWLMLTPQIIVICTGLVALFIEILQPKRNNNPIVGVSLVGLVLAFISLAYQLGMPAGDTFAKMVVRDQSALVLQLVLVAGCFGVFLFSEGYLRQRRIAFAEFYPLALWSTAGGMMMVSTNNLLMLFLGLEVLSIALYCMAGMAREEERSEESALKYFLLGAFASAFFLMGIAFLYGATGSIQLESVRALYEDMPAWLQNFALLGAFLMIIGAGFKLGLVPFHQWTPDVYQGAPTNVTAFMATVSKAAAVGMLIRMLEGFSSFSSQWMLPLMVLAGITMVVGNTVALLQRDVKRVMGYSSVANAGYLLTAILCHFAAPQVVSLTVVYFFLMAYVVMVIGTFAVLSLAAQGGTEGTRMEELQGFWRKSPFAAGMLIIFIASQIGIPPTAGFFAKALIFKGALDASAAQPGLFWLAIILAVTSAVSAAYYLQIIRALVVAEDSPVSRPVASPTPGLKAVLILSAAGVFGLVVFLSPLLTRMETTYDQSVFGRPAPGEPVAAAPNPVIPQSAPIAAPTTAPGTNPGIMQGS